MALFYWIALSEITFWIVKEGAVCSPIRSNSLTCSQAHSLIHHKHW